MFSDASPYAKDLVRKILDNGSKEGTLVGKYQKANNKTEKDMLINESLAKVKKGQGAGIYDAINMLRLAGSNEISQRMYEMLNLNQKRSGNSSSILPVVSYFGSINYDMANKDMKAVNYENDYYSACRIALFKQGVISSDELMAGYLSETRPKQIKNYLSGFGGLNDKTNDVKNSALKYFGKQLNDVDLKNAISNYEKLVKKYKHLFNPQIGELFKEYFGYGTVFGMVQIRMFEQNTILNIIEAIIDSSNYKKYENFLYFVAEQGTGFSPTITSHAREILRNINCDQIEV